MRKTSVAAGAGLAIRRDAELVLLPNADDVLRQAATETAEGSAIAALTSCAQKHEFAVGPFVAVDWSDGLKVVVFGDVELRSDHPSLPSLSGTGSGTWVERSIVGEQPVLLSVHSGDVNDATDLRAGVVEASGFSIELLPSVADSSLVGDSDEALAPVDAVVQSRPVVDEREVDSLTETLSSSPSTQDLDPSALVALVFGSEDDPNSAERGHSVSPGDVSGTTSAGWQVRFEDGKTHPIESVMVIGRSPNPAKLGTDPSAIALAIESPKASSNHLEVRVSNDEVEITDLNSRNGTFMVTTGDRELVRLSPQEPYKIGSGTAVQAGTVLFTIERVDE